MLSNQDSKYFYYDSRTGWRGNEKDSQLSSTLRLILITIVNDYRNNRT